VPQDIGVAGFDNIANGLLQSIDDRQQDQYNGQGRRKCKIIESAGRLDPIDPKSIVVSGADRETELEARKTTNEVGIRMMEIHEKGSARPAIGVANQAPPKAQSGPGRPKT
jgi:hypothetical protein